MNKLQKIITTTLIATSLGLGGFIVGQISRESQINQLNNQLESVQLEKSILRHENYQLHLNLIKRGNPQGWELYGDDLGAWGYRKPDESVLLGGIEGYIYLRE